MIKIQELCEFVDWGTSIYFNSDGPRTFHGVKLAVHTVSEVIVAGIHKVVPLQPRPASSSTSVPDLGAKRLENPFKMATVELTTSALTCGKQNVHHLDREDLAP